MTKAQSVATMVTRGFTETEAHGCRFCGAKAVKYDEKGREWWHNARDCCGPNLAMQAIWRYQEIKASEERIKRAQEEAAKKDKTADAVKAYEVQRQNGLVSEDGEVIHLGFRQEFEEAVQALKARGSLEEALAHLKVAVAALTRPYNPIPENEIAIWVRQNWGRGVKVSSRTPFSEPIAADEALGFGDL